MIQRVPPHSEEAEVALLGSILLDGEAMGSVAPILNPDDFYRVDNGRLYEVMRALYDRGDPVDVLLVRRECEQLGILESVGDEFLSRLADVVSSPAHAEHYAHIVREKSIARSLIGVATEIQQAAFVDEARGEELLDFAESKVFQIGSKASTSGAQDVKSLLNETFEELDRGDGPVDGVLSGFYQFDDYTGGLRPGELIIVAGRPSMGKSSFALNLASNAATMQNASTGQGGASVLIFSLEMTAQNILRNMLCARAGVSNKKMRQRGRFISEDERKRLMDAAGPLFESRMYIDDSAMLTPTMLRSKARRVKSKHGLDLIVVDYLQLMDARGGGAGVESRQQEISYISRALKALARELEVPVIALSQLNRDAEKRPDNKPRLSDLRESGALEQDADVICLLFRPAYYLRGSNQPITEEKQLEAEVIIAKQRNGPTGVVPLYFREEYTRFENPRHPTVR